MTGREGALNPNLLQIRRSMRPVRLVRCNPEQQVRVPRISRLSALVRCCPVSLLESCERLLP
jgi:hypothetical protein